MLSNYHKNIILRYIKHSQDEKNFRKASNIIELTSNEKPIIKIKDWNKLNTQFYIYLTKRDYGIYYRDHEGNYSNKYFINYFLSRYSDVYRFTEKLIIRYSFINNTVSYKKFLDEYIIRDYTQNEFK